MAGRSEEVVVLADGMPVLNEESGREMLNFSNTGTLRRKVITVRNYTTSDVTLTSISGEFRSICATSAIYLENLPSLPLVLRPGEAANFDLVAADSNTPRFFTRDAIYAIGTPETLGSINGSADPGLYRPNTHRGAMRKLGPMPGITNNLNDYELIEAQDGLLLLPKQNWDAAQAEWFSYTTGAWTSLNATGAPSPRQDPTCQLVGNQLIVWGGLDVATQTLLATGALFDLSNGSWSAISATGAPTRRFQASALAWQDQFVIFGGRAHASIEDAYADGGAIYDPATDSWTPLPTLNQPAARGRFELALAYDELYVIGGSDTITPMAGTIETYALDLNAMTWRSLPSGFAERPGE